MSERESTNPASVENVSLPPGSDPSGAGSPGPPSGASGPTGAIGLRLLGSVIALGAGAAALIVAIDLLRGVLG